MFSRFFVDRPIFAIVLSIMILLAGIMSILNLPIAQFPDLVPPSVSVSTTYRGASPEDAAEQVAAVLENQINGVDNMIYMYSTSDSTGSVRIYVYFELGSDPDMNTVNVNNRVQLAQSTLPDEVVAQGITVEKSSSTILQLITLISPDGSKDSIELSNYALLNVIDELKRIPGVGNVTNFASQDYSMRIWFRPDRLTQLNLTPDDIIAAVLDQNNQYSAGRIGETPADKDVQTTYILKVKGRLAEVNEFKDIIIRSNPDGSALRLKDVARVELGAQSYNFVGEYNGKTSLPIAIFPSPGANSLEVSNLVDAKMAELSQRFPKGIAYEIPHDTTVFTRISINEVVHTLIEAIILVFFVVFIFLQNWRATLIPCLAVPVSIVGAFAGMYILDFSINTLTLFGMVLAIGIVVDDAIVVLENVERIMEEEKLRPREATIKAMEEVTGPVVAIVFVLCSVFIPVSFLGGLSGTMYKQFAITIAISVSISGFVALTLTPALCSMILKPEHKKKFWFFRKFDAFFEKVTEKYTAGVRFFLKRVLLSLAIFVGVVIIIYLFFANVPTALVPDEDQGYIMVSFNLPEGAALSRTTEVTNTLGKYIMDMPTTRVTLSMAGYDIIGSAYKTYSGVVFAELKDWSERTEDKQSSFSLVGDIAKFGAENVPEAMVMPFNPPAITGMSNTGGFEVYVQSRSGGDFQTISDNINKLLDAAKKRPELTGLSTTFKPTSPRFNVELDKEKAKSMGVDIGDVYNAMQTVYSSYRINDFNLYTRTFYVMIESEAEYRSAPEKLNQIYLRSSKNEMVPLSTLVKLKPSIGPDVVERSNNYLAAKVVGSPAAGYSSRQAIDALQEVCDTTLPKDYSLSWIGSAYQELASGTSSALAFGLGLLMVFLVLAAQYERWSLPISVLLSVPFGLLGAFLAISLRGLYNDIYFQISLLTLIGLSAKNAILIVEFAVQQYYEGKSLYDSAVTAAHLRFRPIIMTSLAFILGCVPLAVASGAGAASRHSVGTGVVGGMLVSSTIAVLFVPMFFRLVMRASGAKEEPEKKAAPEAPSTTTVSPAPEN